MVFSVPRGSIADTRTGLITTPAGDPIPGEPFKPYAGTPPYELLADQSQTIAEPLPVHTIDDTPGPDR